MNEVIFEEEPVVKDHYSHSQLDLFMRCGEAYRQKYMLGKPSPATLSMVAGKAFHKAMEYLIVGADKTAKEEFENIWADLEPSKMQDKPELEAINTTQGKMWDLALEGQSRYRDLSPVATEEQFNIEIGGMKVTGIIDLVDNQGRIIDWKTGARAPGQYVAENNRQLTLYDYAWRQKTGEAPTGVGIIWGGYQAKGPRFEERWAEPKTSSDHNRVTNAFYTLDRAVKQDGPWHPAEQGSWMCTKDKCPYFAECKVRA